MNRRIFIAINLPKNIRKELENLEKEIQDLFSEDSGGVIKWVKSDNLHLTLLFVGYVRDEEIPQICQIVKELAQAQKPFSLKFEKICYGPPKKIPPRLIWVELEKKPELLELVGKLKTETAQTGILRKFEQRAFSPHITLGRVRAWQWRRIEPEERPTIEREISLNFEVKSIEVMESVLKRTGADYSVLASIQLLGL